MARVTLSPQDVRVSKPNLLDRSGAAVIDLLRYLFYLLALFYLSIKVVWTNRHLGQRDFIRQVLLQIYYTGVQAGGPVIALALAVGAFAIVEGVGGIGSLSGAESLGKMVTVVVLREIAPLLTGGVVIVRSVTAIASELGVMRVQREIEALEVMGISPIRQLVTPRIFGGLLSLFGLNILFNGVALIGGFLIARMLVSIPAELFFRAVVSAVSPLDVVAFSLKILVGGIGVFLIACYHGMAVERSSTEVPVAVSRASLNSLVFLVVLHVGISVAVVLSSDVSPLIGGML
ncbi:MAG: ABC transporter permease [Deltaproteobacteria bacterium]|nr:ABC transporter permease [Deltaproteobacteria bacterium]